MKYLVVAECLNKTGNPCTIKEIFQADSDSDVLVNIKDFFDKWEANPRGLVGWAREVRSIEIYEIIRRIDS